MTDDILYITVKGLHLGPMQYPESQFVAEPTDPNQLTITAKVTGLKPLQMYRFYVWGYTAAGQGSEYFIDDSTVTADCKFWIFFLIYMYLPSTQYLCYTNSLVLLLYDMYITVI